MTFYNKLLSNAEQYTVGPCVTSFAGLRRLTLEVRSTVVLYKVLHNL